jgi:hypothetical protein
MNLGRVVIGYRLDDQGFNSQQKQAELHAVKCTSAYAFPIIGKTRLDTHIKQQANL